MQPTAARSSRSTLQSTVPSTATKLLQHQQQHQQQQILYGPITTPVVALHPCTAGPPCVYPGAQRNVTPASPSPLQMQGKSNRWQSKNKHIRGHQQQQQQQQHQYCQQSQQHPQHQVAYNSKPVLLFDQVQSNVPTPQPPSSASFVLASSTFTHGPYPNEHYNPPGVTLIPQPYFKPPDLQTFCLLKDRQISQQQPQQPMHGSYYNISTTSTCSLQTLNPNSAFQLPNLGPYATVTATFANNQISGPVQSAQTFPTSPMGLVFGATTRDKSILDMPALKCNRSKLPTGCKAISRDSGHDWPSQTTSASDLFDRPSERIPEVPEIASSSYQAESTCAKVQEEHSDESSASFDFTIEAEKMVSALCNTTSLNDLAKDEARNFKMDSASFNGAGDNVTNKSGWFADFSVDFENGRSVGVQTDGPCDDRSQYAELIRKTAYWGCTQAEIILNSRPQGDSRRDWLTGLSSATRTAITKSSTCFPVFAGDRIFANDLISALLRVSNGWLILDNYLNKEHYPSLSGKLNRELVRCFQMWEESTCELLRQIVQTFLKLEKNVEQSAAGQKSEEFSRPSFPGDVCLYTNYDLFKPLSNPNTFRQHDNCSEREVYRRMKRCSGIQNADQTNFRYFSEGEQLSCPKTEETKLRRKWTITENLSPIDAGARSASDVFLGHTESSLHGLSGNGKFRARGHSTGKIEPCKQSLNAEFYHLRNKVLESNSNTTRQWTLKDRKCDMFPDKPQSAGKTFESFFKHQRPSTSGNYEHSQKRSLRSDSFGHPTHLDANAYLIPNQSAAMDSSYTTYSSYPAPEHSKSFKNQAYGNNFANADSSFTRKSPNDQLPAVPRNKVTLLSQIEPSTPEKDTEGMAANLSAWFASMRSVGHHRPSASNLENKTGNDFSRHLQLDADRQLQALQNMRTIQSAPWTACNPIGSRSQTQQAPDEYDSSEDVRVYMKPGSYNVPKKRHQRRPNRRLDNSRNASNASSAPGRPSVYSNKGKDSGPTSSTPMSHATAAPCGATGSSATRSVKIPFPATPIVPPPAFSLENSPRILKRNSSACDIRQDITWKAACASAEILLEALNVKGCSGRSESANVANEDLNSCKKKESQGKTFVETMEKENEENCADASSYEASEDDSGSTYKLSPSTSVVEISQASDVRSVHSKNVKTDSWLIRTLSNANIVPKSKRQKNTTANIDSTESSNASLIDGEEPMKLMPLTAARPSTSSIPRRHEHELLERTSIPRDAPDVEERKPPRPEETFSKMETTAGRATYSETVRRSTTMCTPHPCKKDASKRGKSMGPTMSAMRSAMVPLAGRRSQRKDTERSYSFALLHKSRKSTSSGGKKTKTSEANDQLDEGGACAKIRKWRSEACKESAADGVPRLSLSKFGRKKEAGGFLEGKCAGKSSDRGWSIWYSSKKRQSLSPLTLGKLETVHQMMWQMEDADVFKCPPAAVGDDCRSMVVSSVEDYYKVIRNPIFLETIGYKLKNRIYHKVEHAVRDFRRIVYNSRLYYKNDNDRLARIECLSRKFEDLLEEYFANWDFENISGSPRKLSPMSQRSKQTCQKSIAGRCNNTKKSPSTSIVTESALSH